MEVVPFVIGMLDTCGDRSAVRQVPRTGAPPVPSGRAVRNQASTGAVDRSGMTFFPVPESAPSPLVLPEGVCEEAEVYTGTACLAARIGCGVVGVCCV